MKLIEPPKTGPKILAFDIETSGMLAHVWGVGKNYVTHDDLLDDWAIISFTAKWVGEPNILQMDTRKNKDKKDDYALVKTLLELMDQADFYLTQNGASFDEPRINARAIIHDLPKPSPSKHFDNKVTAFKYFGFTSAKQEYLTKALKVKHQKLKHIDYPGKKLWLECLYGDQKAWNSMAKYNKYDVLGMEEVYLKFRKWDTRINHTLFYDNKEFVCSCGSTEYVNNGHAYTSAGKYRRYKCKECGAHYKDGKNLLPNSKFIKRGY